MAARRHSSSLQYLLFSGLLYVVLFIYGLLFEQNDDANFVPINNGDDWLHAGLALGLLGSWAIARGADDSDRGEVRERPSRRDEIGSSTR